MNFAEHPTLASKGDYAPPRVISHELNAPALTVDNVRKTETPAASARQPYTETPNPEKSLADIKNGYDVSADNPDIQKFAKLLDDIHGLWPAESRVHIADVACFMRTQFKQKTGEENRLLDILNGLRIVGRHNRIGTSFNEAVAEMLLMMEGDAKERNRDTPEER